MHVNKNFLIKEGAFVGSDFDKAVHTITHSAYQAMKRSINTDIYFRGIRQGSNKFEPILSALESLCRDLNEQFRFHKAAIFKVNKETSLFLKPPQTLRVFVLLVGKAQVSYTLDGKYHTKILKPGDCFVYREGPNIKASFAKDTFVIGLRSF